MKISKFQIESSCSDLSQSFANPASCRALDTDFRDLHTRLHCGCTTVKPRPLS